MLQVPMFGMENNPESLKGRRRGFAIAYGYPSESWPEVTELIGHVPYVPATDIVGIEGIDSEWVEVELYSSVVPYCRAWVKVRTERVVDECREYERGNLWTVNAIRAL
jgi:hypothetical protein